ncbi:ankyrin repeat-containing domain protein [Aspergillus leporis]|uniref:Ankyrin repeat-containing domain protein n=1 Tax=Aspergillus leporis TaxID=41062 RepID=A0A5N5X089_9EURO|nr:ankyrin repeat-containing domain protein [Aspergillus leporis]
MGLQEFSVETIVTILGFLDVGDILNLRYVCRYVDRVILRNVLYLGLVSEHMNDRLWSRLVFEEITHDVSSHDNIARIVSRLRSLSTGECCAENCRKAISTALVCYKGRAWVKDNIKRAMRWAETWDDAAIMVVGAWLGLKDVVEMLLKRGVRNKCHDYLGSAMYAAAFNDDETLLRLLIEDDVNIWREEGAYGDVLQLAAYRGSENVAGTLIAAKVGRGLIKPFGYGPYGSPLGAAAAAGHGAIVRMCLRGQMSARRLGPFLRSPLFYAARSGRADAARILLDSGILRPNLNDEFHATPLTVAVEAGHEDVVSLLLSSDKINADCPSVRGDKPTPLQIACHKGYTNIVRMLLRRRDVDVNGRGNGDPPILAAAMNGHEEIVKLLLTKWRSHYDQQFLPLFASRGLIDMVKLVLDSHIINPNVHDSVHRTALHYAVLKGHEDIVRLLLQQSETCLNYEDDENRTPLIMAIERKDIRLCRILLSDMRISVGKSNYWRMTPLHVACQHGVIAAVEALLARQDVDVNAKDAKYSCPLSYAISSGNRQTMKLLFSHPHLDPGQCDNSSNAPLYLATKSANWFAAHLLMEQYRMHANSWCGEYLATPLMIAAARGDTQFLSMFLKKDTTNVNLQNSIGCSALGVAASHAQAEAVRMLLEHPEIDVNQRSADGTTVFLMAARGGQMGNMLRLLEKGADPALPNDNGEAPIYTTAEHGHYDAVLLLLAQVNVNPDHATHQGETPLSAAARNGHVAVVRLLLEQGGVEFDPRRRRAKTLLSAITNTEVIQLLVEAGDRCLGVETQPTVPIW